MRYATAIWNYVEPDVGLTDLIEEFVGFGYDAISFSSTQLPRLEEQEACEIASLIAERGLAVTLHCSFDITSADVERALGLFGEALHAMTFDAAMVWETRGGLYDAARMAPMLSDVIAMSDGTQLRVGVEDFPLDDAALDFYRSDLEPLLTCPRYGILIDVGHLNMRLNGGGYFEGVSVAEYLARVPLPVVEVHLHDNSGDRDEHGHFGSGNIDFEEVARVLKAIDFRGVSTIEICPGMHDSTPEESKPHSRASLAAWKALWEG